MRGWRLEVGEGLARPTKPTAAVCCTSLRRQENVAVVLHGWLTCKGRLRCKTLSTAKTELCESKAILLTLLAFHNAGREFTNTNAVIWDATEFSFVDGDYIIKSRRSRWAGRVARMGQKRNAYRLLLGIPDGKRALERLRRR
jgi:hypothetical protein